MRVWIFDPTSRFHREAGSIAWVHPDGCAVGVKLDHYGPAPLPFYPREVIAF